MKKTTGVLGIIPARFDSSRFPGKVLVDIQGKPMIQRVFEQAKKSKLLDRIVVATDDERVFEVVERFGGEAIMTDKSHQSGTDRCAEILKYEVFKAFDFVVNIQGDEPFIQPEQIDKLVAFALKNKAFSVTTLAKKIEQAEDLFSPNAVKVVFGKAQNALYFSRNAIPYLRDEPLGNWLASADFHKHIGLYAFQKKVLEEVAQLPVARLEKWEKLEQLRWLENGYSIGVELTEMESYGIDSKEDLARVKIPNKP